MEKAIFNATRFLAIVPIALIVFGGIETPLVPIAVTLILYMSVYMVIASRNNYMMLAISFIIAYSNYSILYANFINPIDAAYTSVITIQTTYISLNILLFFNSLLILMVRWDKMVDTSSINLSSPKLVNKIYIALIIFILVYIFIYGYERPSELGMRGSPSPLYEYSLAIFIILFYYWGNHDVSRRIGLFFVVMFAMQNFIFGGRILGIQFLLCAFFMLYMNKFRKRTVLLVGTFFILLMVAIGRARGAFLVYGFDIVQIIAMVIRDGFALDTAYSSYFTSETFVYCQNQIPFEDRFDYFVEFVKGIFLGVDAKYIPQTISKSYIFHSNGGVLPHFLYFYLGNWGLLIGAVLVSIYLNLIRKVSSKSSGLMKVIAVFVSCHTFRWYLYSPIGLLRGVLFMTIVYFVFKYLIVLSNNNSVVKYRTIH